MRQPADWLGPGHLLVRRADATGWVLHVPDGRVLDVDASVIPGTSMPDELGSAAVRSAFADAGFGPQPVEPPVPWGEVPVKLLGDPRDLLLTALRARLVEAGAQVESVDPGQALQALARPITGAGRQVFVACATGPAGDEWLHWEQHLPAPSAWMRVSVESGQLYLEPPATGVRGVTHQMVRARRLAASLRPTEQRGLWRDDLVAGPPLLGRAATEMVVDLVVADIVEYLHARVGDLPTFGRTLRVLDLHTLQLAAHPVLPVPTNTQWRDS